MARRSSLTLTVAGKTEDRRRRRTADARLEPLIEPLSPLTPALSSRTGSSPEMPLIICSDDDTNDATHRRSRSDKKDSKKTPMSETGVQSAGTSGRLDKITTHGSPVNEGRAHRSIGSERDPSPSPHRPISFSYCGRPYVKLGCMRNHQESCDKCKVEQEKDKDTTGGAQEILGGGEGSKTRTTLPSSADGIPNGKDDRKDDDRSKAKMSQACKEEIRGSNDTSAQMVSVDLCKVASEKLLKTEEQGYIYVYRDTKGGLVKIGYSNDPNRRGQQHKKCEANLLNIHISHCVKSMKRAERLVKLDLRHLCRPWYCDNCTCTHKEYFEVEENKAKMIVDRWVDWINICNPYEKGSLLPIWSYLLHFGRVAASGMGLHDHEARWTHWKWVLSVPSHDDFARFTRFASQSAPRKDGCSGGGATTGQHADSGETDRGSQHLSRRNGDLSVIDSTLTLLGPVNMAVDRKGRNRYSMTFELECRLRPVQENISVDRSSQQ